MRFALGQALFERDDLAGAVRVLATYLQKTPAHRNRPYALYYLGYAHFNLTQFERAAAAFADLASAYPQSELAPDALFRAGEAHYNLGQFETAQEHYQQLLAMHPRSDLADDALYNLAWSPSQYETGVPSHRRLPKRGFQLPKQPSGGQCPVYHRRFLLQ